jgi:hypothetical protein
MMSTKRSRRRPARLLLTGAIAVIAATTLTPLFSASASASVPAGIAAPRAAAAADTPDRLASDEEKANAVAVLGIVADEKWLIYNDRDFVAAIILAAPDTLPEVQAAGRLAWFSDDADTVLAFIQYEIFEAKARDDNKIIRDAETLRQERDLRRSAASTIGVVVDEQMLILTRSDFLHELYVRATGPKVKAGALAAMDVSSEQQVEFLQNGIKALQQEDVADAIAADEATSAAEKARLLDMAAKARAAATVLGVVIDEGTQSLSDDNFLRFIRRQATETWQAEVSAGAFAALDSPDPTVWKAFIDTGIYEANARDIEREMKVKGDADKAAIQKLLTAAEADGQKNFSLAARAALAGSRADYDAFLRTGRYTVRPDQPDIIKAAASGKCLIVPTNIVPDSTTVVQVASCTTFLSLYQNWEIVPIAAQEAKIRNPHSNKCLAVKSASKTAGALLVQADCSSTKPEQSWNIQKDNSGNAQIQNNNSLMCLESTPAFTQQVCKESIDQEWQVISRGLGEMTSGDFNGDGYADLVALRMGYATAGARPLYFFPGTAAGGSFGTRQTIAGNWDGLEQFAVGRINHDDEDDLVAIETATSKMYMYPGTGNGTFGTRVEIATGRPWTAVHELTIGKFNGDAYDDILGVANTTGQLRMFAGTATEGVFSAYTELAKDVSGMMDFTVAKFNRDDYDDLIAVNLTDGALKLHAGKAAGGAFATPTNLFSSGWTGYHQLTGGKFNRDAYPDIVTFEQATSKFWLYPGTSTGGVGTRVEIGIGG